MITLALVATSTSANAAGVATKTKVSVQAREGISAKHSEKVAARKLAKATEKATA